MYTIWPGQEGISFDDYRGQPEIVSQAKQIVKLLRGVKVFEDAGGEPLNGLLLEGPPGTGKTYLAQAISKEAGVPFFFVDASSLNGMFMGIYYSLQRLCKARMFSDTLSWINFWGWQLIIVAAAISLPLGFTTSKEYAELEWPIDIAIAVVWATLVSRFSASKLDDPSRLWVEIGIVACGAAALVRVGHPVLSVLLVLLAATQLTLAHVLNQR